MFLILLLWLRLIQLGSAQTTCRPHTPPSSGRVVLTYTPYVTPQIAPTSTVYRHIVTAWTYAVDCRYVSIQQVDDNQPAIGPFSGTPTTVDALTITRIGCIQQTSAITRRDVVRGFPAETSIASKIDLIEPGKKQAGQKRATLAQNVVDVASKQADEIPPNTQEMSVKAYDYLVQVNTALYTLNLYNTGFNMSATCTLLADPITQARLILASVDPQQAQAIVCYAANYGLFFDMSNAQLLSDLLGIIYSIEVKSGFSNNSTIICDSLRLGAASFLGVDAQGIRSYICGDELVSISSTNQSTATLSTFGTGILGTAVTASPTNPSSSVVPPFANSTTSTIVNATVATASFGTGLGTVTATRTQQTGTASPNNVSNSTHAYPTYSASLYNSSGNGVASDSFSIVFPNATAAFNGSESYGGHLPPSPTAAPYYAVWTTSTTLGARLPRY